VARPVAGLAEAFERIGSFLERRLPLTHAPGAAIAVTDREEILGVVVRGFADAAAGVPVRPETRFEIGSISKSFAAIVAVQEAEAGRLDLRTPVTELLPWLELEQPFGAITPHHLLTHSSGLAIGTEESPTGPGALWLLRHVPPTFPPGERFHYSNDGYKVLGAILEHVGGRAVPELLRERIFEPLGMRATEGRISNRTRRDLAVGYEPIFDDRPPQRHHELVPAWWIVSETADGSIVSNVLDMSAYARLLLGGGTTTKGTTVLSEEGFATFTRPVIDEPVEEREVPGRYAYGISVGRREGRSILTHSGGMVGYTALLMLEPQDGLGCVMLLNGQGDRLQTVGFALDAVRAALRGDPLPEVTSPADPAAIPNAADYTGTYRGGGREVRIEAAGAGLVLQEGPVRAALEREPLAGVAHDPDRFLVVHEGLDRYAFSFGRDAEGRVVEAFHGPSWLRGASYDGPEAPVPKGWSRLEGVYRSNDPWSPVLRVFARADRLHVLEPGQGEEHELTPLGDGSFAARDPALPRRFRFHGDGDGRAVVAEYNGGRWYRSNEE
jgi:CubicO group peptidase (beta-lactamase class C family)